ncbi:MULTISPECIES: hypothetical protein [unclassified Streptomyces]
MSYLGRVQGLSTSAQLISGSVRAESEHQVFGTHAVIRDSIRTSGR